MKKVMIIALVVLGTMSAHAQLNYNSWQSKVTVDEFGDPTDDIVYRIFSEGTFSNSATSNSDLTAKVGRFEDGFYIELYEYSSPPGARLSYTGEHGYISIKTDNGSVKTVSCFASDDGGLWFFGANAKKFDNILRNTAFAKISIDEDNFDGGSSTYRFKITTNNYKEITTKII